MNDVFARTDALSVSAAFHLDRTKVIQGNIANADTPGFRPKELTFSENLTSAMAMKKTDSKHLDVEGKSGGTLQTVTLEERGGYDRNRVDVDEEMSKLAESAIMYKSTVESLKKELSKLQLVISGR